MSKAYRCDRCGQGFDGTPDSQIGHDKETEIRWRAILRIKLLPESPEPTVYFKDICPRCFRDYIEFWKATPTPEPEKKP